MRSASPTRVTFSCLVLSLSITFSDRQRMDWTGNWWTIKFKLATYAVVCLCYSLRCATSSGYDSQSSDPGWIEGQSVYEICQVVHRIPRHYSECLCCTHWHSPLPLSTEEVPVWLNHLVFKHSLKIFNFEFISKPFQEVSDVDLLIEITHGNDLFGKLYNPRDLPETTCSR